MISFLASVLKPGPQTASREKRAKVCQISMWNGSIFIYEVMRYFTYRKKKKILDIRFSLVLRVELPPPSGGEGLAVITLSWFHMSKTGIKWQKKSYPIYTLLKRKNNPAAKHWALISSQWIRRLSKSDKKYNKNKTEIWKLNTVF